MMPVVQEKLPEGLHVKRIANGAAELQDGGDYEVKLILVPAPPQQPADRGAATKEGTTTER